MAAEKIDTNSFASFIIESNTVLSQGTSKPFINSNQNKLSSASSSMFLVCLKNQHLIFLYKQLCNSLQLMMMI